MDAKGLVYIVLIVIGFSSGGWFAIQTNDLTNEVESLNSIVDEYEAEISNLSSIRMLLEAENEQLDIQLNGVQAELSVIRDERDDLSGQVSTLQENILTLEDEKESLEDSLESKRASLYLLEQRHDELQDDYYQLEIEYNVEKELRIGNSLESYYDSLREGLGPTGSQYWWYTPEKDLWQTEVDFAADLALHDLWRIYWPYYETDYEEMTGENSYETAYNKLSTIISYIDFSSSDSPTMKITKILSFLDEHIHYESEVNDIFLAPVETLGFKSGDCDDYSILAAALFEWVEIDSAIGFFKNEDDEYHAMVLVHLETLDDYGYWYYEDLTDYGLDEGSWLIIEPQTTIGDQESSWVAQWSLLVTGDLENTS